MGWASFAFRDVPIKGADDERKEREELKKQATQTPSPQDGIVKDSLRQNPDYQSRFNESRIFRRSKISRF